MLNAAGEVLYIGKAKNLKKRVTSYFKRKLDTKSIHLVTQLNSIEITVTRNEREALLLENNLIKAQKPRYNIIFRDDKSYPYLKLSVQESFPRLSFHRGIKRDASKYFGPYPSTREAREALTLLQHIFRLRQCDEVFFKNRSRPCLQYQIKRCSAPCVGYITLEAYKKDVEYARLFLEGKNKAVIEQLIPKMEQASHDLEFEKAARIRDQIALLRNIQERQIIVGDMQDADVLGIHTADQHACIQVLVIREGKMLGSRQYLQNKLNLLALDHRAIQTLLRAFILQYYITTESESQVIIPKLLLLPCMLEEKEVLESILSERSGHAVHMIVAKKGNRLRWLNMAMNSAKLALVRYTKHSMDLMPRFQALQEALGLDTLPERLECFDVSHTLGEATVVSCVVFDSTGPVKSAYRRFNIQVKTKGDDYAALKEGLTRHYTRLKSEGKLLPEVLIVDGGKGQLAVAQTALEELQVVGPVLLAVAKGPQRKAELETIYIFSNGKRVKLQVGSLALRLIQQIRDEAHRFAITAHRKQRARQRKASVLEKVAGIGSKRRQNLLQYFGGLKEISKASVETLAKTPGLNRALAERLYEALHGR